MTKRIFALMLALTMVLSLLPTVVLAEDAVTATAKAGQHTGAGHSDDCGLTDGWQAWDKADSLPTGGRYYLTKNVTVSGELYLMQDLTLCLNGFVVSTSNPAKRLISTQAGSGITLTITDCTAYEEDDVYYAGALTGGKDASTLGGGAILVRYGTTAKFYDGRITGNTSSTAGGAVALQAASGTSVATFSMFGGEISHNTAISGTKYKTGGAFYVANGGVVDISGGRLTGNTGSGGGVLYAADDATVSIRDAVITGNTASYTGAVLHCAKGAQVIIRDSQLTGNICTSTSGGGTIRMDGSKGRVTLAGSTVIAHNDIPANQGDIMLMSTYNDTLQVDGLAAGSDVRFCTPATEPATANEIITVTGSQTQWGNGWVTFVDKAGTAKRIGYDGTSFSFLEGHFHAEKEFLAWDKADSLPASGSYYLTGDVTVSKQVTVSDTLELCLNGHTVNGYKGRAFDVAATGTLKLYNCGSDAVFTGFDHTAHGGVIQSAGTVHAENITFRKNATTNYGGALLSTGGTVTFQNCKFTENKAAQGGALSIGGTAVLTGCSFTGNYADSAGVLRAAGSKTVLVDGCSFTGNSAKVAAAIAAASSGVELTLKDTAITGNSVSVGYGAVNLIGTAKPIKLLGKVTVTGNTLNGAPCNLHVQNGATEGYDASGLTEGVLGISLEAARIAAGKLTFTTANAANDKGFFTSDNGEYAVVLNGDNKLQLQLLPKPPVSDHKHHVCGNADCADHDYVEYLPWDKTDSLPSTGSWYLKSDVTVSAETAVSEELKLCLNGFKVTTTAGRAYKITGTASIADCGRSGCFTGFTTTAGGGVFHNAGVLSLYNLTLSENSETGGKHGGAIFSSGTLYAEKVTFHKNTTTGYGGAVLSSGPVTMKQCVFTENTAQEGGAVSLAGQTVLEDCTFTKNTALAASGAARVAGSSTVLFDRCVFTENTAKGTSAITATSSNVELTLKNVTVTGNSNTGGYGAVNVIGSAKPIKLLGKVTVTGNTLNGTPCNLHVQNGATDGYDVTGLAEGSTLGISLEAARITAGKLTFTTANENNNKAFFTSDDAAYEIVLNQENKLSLKTPDPVSNHKHCICGSGRNTHCDHTVVEFFDWDDPNALPTEGSWCLTTDVVLPTAFGVSKELKLCLNGHSIRVGDQGGRVYYCADGAKIAITDCAQQTGTISGATSSAVLFNAECRDARLELWNGSFTDNHLVGGGGAIVIQGQTVFNMYGGKIFGNSATSQLKLDGEGKPLLDDKGNQTYYAANGGAVFINTGATFNMFGGEISENKTTHVEHWPAGAAKASKSGGNGGALAVYGTANLQGGKIANNEAFLGGGVFISGSTAVLELAGTEISGNKAVSAGGVLCQSKAAVLLKDGKVTGNTATLSGAGIYMASGSKLTIQGGEVSANHAENNGGGIYLQKAEAVISGGKVTGNAAKVLGGAVYATDSSQLTLQGGALTNNTAKGGGAVLTDGKSALLMTGGSVTGNKTTSAGAGAYISVGTTFTMQGGTISGNAAQGDGGGIYLLRATAKLTGGSVTGNSAVTGGGLKMNGGKLTLNGISFTANKANGRVTYNAAGEKVQVPGYGGALTIAQGGYTKNGVEYSDCPVVEMYDAYIADNYALSAAGGIQVVSKGTVFNMYGGTVTGNKAGSAGGGIYFSTNTLCTVTGGTVTKNHAKNGGGIYFLNCEAKVSGIELSGNTADATGAAAVISGKTAVVSLKDLQIRNNAAQSNGGALMFQTYATVTLENAQITGNTGASGGAIYLAVPAYATLKNVELAENEATETAGGAVYLSSNAIVTLEDSTIRDNKAAGSGGGLYNRGRLELKNCKVLNNASGKSGGGIGSGKVTSALLEDDAGVFAENTVFTGNSAAEQAGAVYNNRGCPVYLTKCLITDNKAGKEGGAIWSDGRLGLTDVTVTGNSAMEQGFAVVITGSQFDGHSYLTGHRWISGEMIVKDNTGGDLYLQEGAILAVTGESLAENSHVATTLQTGLLSQTVFGVYGYEGETPNYIITAGDRSIIDPELPPQQEPETQPTETTQPAQEVPAVEDNTLLYAGIGGIAAVILLAAIAVVVIKKKKAGKAGKE